MDIQRLHQAFLGTKGAFTDTREVLQGGMFFALKGERFNGNTYALKALEQGAALAIVDEDIEGQDDNCIRVDNVLETLQALGAYHRVRWGKTIIGITGSNGKTTSKELIREVLSQQYSVYATDGNLNNHIGVPLCLLRLQEEHELAIIEMGANHVGEIEFLTGMAKPDLGLITNIGTAHIGEFGGQANIIKGKTELYRHIQEQEGMLYVHRDSEVLMEQSEGIPRKTYGADPSSDIQVTLHDADPALRIDWRGHLIQLNLVGGYNVSNAAAAIAFGLHFAMSETDIIRGLESYLPDNNRSEMEEIGGLRVIKDAYNANPSSMQAALSNFSAMKAKAHFFLLGDMFELGEEEERFHKEIIQAALDTGSQGIFIGTRFSKAAQSIDGAEAYPSLEAAEEAIKSNVPREGLLLLKGSRSMALERSLSLIRSVL